MVGINNPRIPDSEVDAIFLDRWSPRSFDPSPLSEEQIAMLFEAARWSPSCFNEQPWLFCYATDDRERRRFSMALVEKNRFWADRAPLLMFLLARKKFKGNEKTNRHAPFDAGAAWMALALQARRLGLYAHAMAGFRVDQAAEILEIEQTEYDVMAAIAVGRRYERDVLPEDLQRLEMPNQRRPSVEIARCYPL